MKKIILKLLFALLFVTVIMSCSKNDPFYTNVSPYDLRDPGLYSEQIGEVKWIFSLEPGETKYLEIDGHMYKVHFKEIYREDIWTDDTYWTYKYYMNLFIDKDSFMFPYDEYKNNIFSFPIKGITEIFERISKVVDSDKPKEMYDIFSGKTFLINDTISICNPAISTPISGDCGILVDWYYFGYFAIIEK